MMQFNSYQGSDPYILACFHRSDQKKVFSLLDLLNENGYRIKYLDETQINQTNIFSEIKKCAIFLLFLNYELNVQNFFNNIPKRKKKIVLLINQMAIPFDWANAITPFELIILINSPQMDEFNQLKNKIPKKCKKNQNDKENIQIVAPIEKNQKHSENCCTIYNKIDATPNWFNSKNQENVRFAVYTPKKIYLDSDFILNVWAFLDSQRETLRKIATLDGNYQLNQERGPIKVQSEEEIVFQLMLPSDFQIENKIDRLLWLNEPSNAQFRIHVPKTIKSAIVIGQIFVLIKNVRMLILHFNFQVETDPETKNIGNTLSYTPTENFCYEEPIRSAFASYSIIDKEDVYRRIQTLQAIGVDIWVDKLNLRQGDHWQDKIFAVIKEYEHFLLFWSRNARKSKYVEQELQFALQVKGQQYIHPIPLEPPNLVDPPTCLAHLQFDDPILAFIKHQ